MSHVSTLMSALIFIATASDDAMLPVLQCVAVCGSVLQCVAVCCSVLQCVAVRYSVLQCVAVCCSVLRSVAVCCSVLQCVAYFAYPFTHTMHYVRRPSHNDAKRNTLLQFLLHPQHTTHRIWMFVCTRLCTHTHWCAQTLSFLAHNKRGYVHENQRL